MWNRSVALIGLLVIGTACAQAPLSVNSFTSPTDPFSLLASRRSSLFLSEPDSAGAAESGPSAEASRALWLDALEEETAGPPAIRQTTMMQLPPPLQLGQLGQLGGVGSGPFSGSFSTQSQRFGIGLDLYSAPEFQDGLIVYGRNVALKIGGYVKADFIYDFDPIDSTDSFVTTTIPVGAPPRTNSRAHARQSRLSFDTRWRTGGRVVQVYVEGDFFSEDNQFRLRHAYGEVGSLLVGQTWSTFADVAAAPATLDFEGSVSNVNRRQAQARWTQPIMGEAVTLAIALEDTRFIIVPPPLIPGEPRSTSPDVVAHLRLINDWGRFQFAFLSRTGGFQPEGEEVVTGKAWGMNFTGVVMLLDSTKAYYQFLFGEGIGSYRDLPDAAPSSPTDSQILPLFGWMVGVTHDWNDRYSSNFTYAQNKLDNAPLQDPDDVSETTYLAANLIWSPLERVKVGVEYLYGIRQNVDLSAGDAHRIQSSVVFVLP
jgi:hypothetical protein